MRTAAGPHTVQMYGYLQDKRYQYILMEYCQRGDLWQLLTEENGYRLDEGFLRSAVSG